MAIWELLAVVSGVVVPTGRIYAAITPDAELQTGRRQRVPVSGCDNM